MSSGKIVKRWQQIVSTLKADCDKLGEGMRALVQKRWFFSDPEGTSPVGKFDFAKVHDDLFDRTEAEEHYVEAYEDRENRNRQDMAVAKVQSDQLSGSERDFVLRHRTRIRRAAHEAVSKKHMGSDRGVLTASTEYYLQKQLRRIQDPAE